MAKHTLIIRSALAIAVVVFGGNLLYQTEKQSTTAIAAATSMVAAEFTETPTDEMIALCKDTASLSGHYSESLMYYCLQAEMNAKKANQKLINDRN